MKKISTQKNAFTLAEVLITLGIIGVVAAMTIPTILNNIQEQQFKTAYKKAFSAASQSILSANQQDLFVSVTGEGDPLNQDNFLAFMSQFKVIKKCTNNDNQQCWNPIGDKYNVSYPISSCYAFVDASGFAWSMYWPKAGSIFVDTNGDKPPNKWGKDRFVFVYKGDNGGIATGVPTTLLPKNDGFLTPEYYGTSWLYK